MDQNLISKEDIENFMNGRDPMERIVNITYNYQDNFVTIFYRDESDRKCSKKENFFPFVWATRYACNKLIEGAGGRNNLKKVMNEFDVGVKKLSTNAYNGEDRLQLFEDGYLFMFYAKKPMAYSKFLNFFKRCNNSVYSNKDEKERSSLESRQYLCVTPVEQFMIATGKRYFKGYIDYDETLRMIIDLETEGLDPKRHRIKQIGVRTNRGFNKILSTVGKTKEERDKSELENIETFLKMIYTFKPDIITAHNGENFDFSFTIIRCDMLGAPMETFSSKYFNGDFIRKENRDTTLKLGGETETYRATIIPNTIVTDSLHAVRRAQAIDSNMLRADLKYATKYAKMVKPNRVYTPGDKIDEILEDTVNQYAFNDTDGDWYIYDPDCEYDSTKPFVKGKDGDKPFKMFKRNVLYDGYEIVTGRYIIERYLYDDLWECDKVELKYNTTNFLICKMLPVPYKKCTTMGTAGQWKALLMAWSYEHNLAIPMFKDKFKFTGGLSRLLQTGYVDNVVKLDYNSLYPSIILTWGISDQNDLMNTMLKFLEFVLTEREKYKGLKKKAGKTVDKLKGKVQNGTATQEEINEFNQAGADYAFNDKKQSQMKVFGNSFFGSYGATDVFPWGSMKCAEMTTCIGRQSLRLMISHFANLGYKPIVGDSFTGDTPLFIRYNNPQNEITYGCIDIKPISELIDERSVEVDELGREYDRSEKSYQVLCRSGWYDVNYVYRHKTNKDIYEVIDGDTKIEVTEDHSLFSDKQEKIKPSEINEGTKLEYYRGKIVSEKMGDYMPEKIAYICGLSIRNNETTKVPLEVMNGSKKVKIAFLNGIGDNFNTKDKTLAAKIIHLINVTK